MEVITKTEGPVAELVAELTRRRTAGEFIVRIDLSRDEYDALLDDLEATLGQDLRGQGPLGAFEGAPVFVDGKPASMLSTIQVPTRGRAP